MGNVNSENLPATEAHALEVARAAKQELGELLRQRAEIMRRIGTAKQTIIGLATLFGGTALQAELQEVADNRVTRRQPGFTRACRLVLIEAAQPLNSREMCQRLWTKHRDLALRHKDLLASVTTVMNRLVAYGEARVLEKPGGRRSWEWVAQPDGEPADAVGAVSGPSASTVIRAASNP